MSVERLFFLFFILPSFVWGQVNKTITSKVPLDTLKDGIKIPMAAKELADGAVDQELVNKYAKYGYFKSTVDITGIAFQSVITADNKQFGSTVRLYDCLFSNDISTFETIFHQRLSLTAVKFDGAVFLAYAKFEKDVEICQNYFSKDLSFENCTFSHYANISDNRFSGERGSILMA